MNTETSAPLTRREIEDWRLALKVYFPNDGRERHMFNRICDQAVRSLKAPVPEVRLFNRAEIMERVEAYFGRVRKLGGDSGECSAAGVADFLLYQAETDNFAPSIALPSPQREPKT